MRGRREGVVLVTALCVIAALALATAGLLFVSTQEAVVAESWAAALRARLAAEAAAREALARWRTADVDDLAPGGERGLALPPASEPDVLRSASAVRLAGRLFLVRAEAAVVAPAGATLARARSGVVVAVVTPLDLSDLFPAALVSAGPADVGAGARVLGGGEDAAACEADASRVAPPGGDAPGLVVGAAADARIEAGAELGGAPPLLVDSAAAAARSGGPLRWETARSLADHTLAGSYTPAPALRGGECDAGVASNWGDPLDPASPCAAHLPVLYAPGDLTVRGGVGQGVLLVAGRLRMADGARFFGAVLAGAGVELDGGAEVAGAVRADEARLGDARVRFSACALWRAFRRSAGLNRPFRNGERVWVPQF